MGGATGASEGCKCRPRFQEMNGTNNNQQTAGHFFSGFRTSSAMPDRLKRVSFILGAVPEEPTPCAKYSSKAHRVARNPRAHRHTPR